MTSAWAMAWLILTPLVAAALAFAFPRLGRSLALGTAGVVGIAVVRLMRLVFANGVQTHRVGGWGAPLGIELRADGLGVLMLIVTALIGVAIALYSQRYFVSEHDDEAMHRESTSGRSSCSCGRPSTPSICLPISSTSTSRWRCLDSLR